MLNSKNRFHRRNHVNYVYKKGTSIRGEDISLKYVMGQSHESFRAAVVVSKKVSKSAVKRNRIRRRVYEVLRLKMPDIQPGTDVILSVFDERVATIPAEELTSMIQGLLKKGHLLR